MQQPVAYASHPIVLAVVNVVAILSALPLAFAPDNNTPSAYTHPAKHTGRRSCELGGGSCALLQCAPLQRWRKGPRKLWTWDFG
jgi:hypothetical protein